MHVLSSIFKLCSPKLQHHRHLTPARLASSAAAQQATIYPSLASLTSSSSRPSPAPATTGSAPDHHHTGHNRMTQRQKPQRRKGSPNSMGQQSTIPPPPSCYGADAAAAQRCPLTLKVRSPVATSITGHPARVSLTASAPKINKTSPPLDTLFHLGRQNPSAHDSP